MLPAWYFRACLSEELLAYARHDAERIATVTRTVLQSAPAMATRHALDASLAELGKTLRFSFAIAPAPDQPPLPGAPNETTAPEANQPAVTILVDDLPQSGQIDVATTLRPVFSPGPLRLRISIPMPELQQKIQRLQSHASYAFLAAFALVVAFTLLPIRRLDGSMTEVIRVADDIGRGDFKKRSVLYANKDFPALSASIRRMAERIETHIFVITEQNCQLEAILDSMNEGVMVLDSSCRILTVNKAMGRIRRHADKYIGRRPLEMVDSPELQKACDAIATGKHKDGGMTTTMQIEPVKDTVYDVTIACLRGDGHDTGEAAAIAVFHDISALKRLERCAQRFCGQCVARTAYAFDLHQGLRRNHSGKHP